MSPSPASGDRVRQLSVAAVELRSIGMDAGRTSQLATEYGRQLAPLLTQLNELIGGTSTGADKQLALLVTSTQRSLVEAGAALDAAVQRARRAEADAAAAARNAMRDSGKGDRR